MVTMMTSNVMLKITQPCVGPLQSRMSGRKRVAELMLDHLSSHITFQFLWNGKPRAVTASLGGCSSETDAAEP